MFKRNFFLQAPDGDPPSPTAPTPPVAPPVAPPVVPPTSAAPPAPPPDPKGDWPEDWRAKVSADPKHAKTLERFASPKDVWTSYEALRQRLSSGELKAVAAFPKEGTPEQQAAWRTENGIPPTSDKYDIKFDDTVKFSEADQPVIESFLKSAHEANMPPELAKAALGWYAKHNVERQAKIEAAFDENKKKTEDALRAEWGTDYRTNQNLIGGLLDGYVGRDSEMYPLIQRAVESNGEYARFMARMAREINPVHAIVPGEGGNVAGRVDDRIKSIEETMRKDRKAYNSDSKMQQEYRELLNAKARMK